MIDQRTTDFSTLPPIIAVDFDGTLVTDVFPEIGNDRNHMIAFIRRMQALGVKTILWTSRTGEYLDDAVKWCEEHNLHFDAINDNLEEVQKLTGQNTRKVYANVYLDDKNGNIGDIQHQIQQVMSWLGKK